MCNSAGYTMDGSEFFNQFRAKADEFTLTFEDMIAFFGGIKTLIGAPNLNLHKAMTADLCCHTNFKEKFTINNYRITTTSETEGRFGFAKWTSFTT